MAPFLAPVVDHQREQVTVLVGSRCVGFPLVPNRSLDSVTEMGLEDPVVNIRRTLIPSHLVAEVFQLVLFLFASIFFLAQRLESLRVGRPVVHHFVEATIGLEQFGIDPSFAGRTPPGVVDHPDRYAGRLVDLPRKEITHCGKLGYVLRSAYFPLPIVMAPDRLLRAGLREVDHSDVRIVRG